MYESSPCNPRVLLDGLAYVESPRWHDGRLWFAHWGTGEIVAVDLEGHSEVVAQGPPRLGWSMDWLPDGRLLVTGPELLRQERDASMVRHADLGGDPPTPGLIALVSPDGTARGVATDIEFPNGMVSTPDNATLIMSESFAGRLTAFDTAADRSLSGRRIWADGVGPDGPYSRPRSAGTTAGPFSSWRPNGTVSKGSTTRSPRAPVGCSSPRPCPRGRVAVKGI